MQQSTNAQIQIGETIAVIIVFTVLLIFGLYWFSSSAGAQVAQQQTQLENLELLEMTKAIMELPELQCSIAQRAETSCVDYRRLQALNNAIEDTTTIGTYYRDRYSTNTRGSYALELIDVQTDQRHPIFDFTTNNPNASTQTQPVPAVLYNPVTQRYNFSMLLLTQEVLS